MRRNLRELWGARELLNAFVRRDLRVRYRGSYFGFIVSILVPVAYVAVLTVVLKNMTDIMSTEKNYSAQLFCALLPWGFLHLTTINSCKCVSDHRDIVKKVYFPRELLPLSVMLGNLIHLGLSFLLFFAFLFAFIRAPFLWTLVLVPVLLFLHSCLALGLALAFSALDPVLRDVRELLNFAFTLLFFVCPLIYRAGKVKAALGDWAYDLYMLNPVAVVVEGIRYCVLGGGDYPPPELRHFAVFAAVCLGVLALGYAIFRRIQWRLPELI